MRVEALVAKVKELTAAMNENTPTAMQNCWIAHHVGGWRLLDRSLVGAGKGCGREKMFPILSKCLSRLSCLSLSYEKDEFQIVDDSEPLADVEI